MVHDVVSFAHGRRALDSALFSPSMAAAAFSIFAVLPLQIVYFLYVRS
jgi:hypothetical protein